MNTRLLKISVVLMMLLLPVSMMAQITVAVDNTSTFVPTQIVNGDFSTRPYMPFKYNDTWYNEWSSSSPNTGTYWTEVNPNGIGQGWNTTETQVYDHGLFEWTDYMFGYNVTLYGNGNNDGHGCFLEMNACNSAVFYQDLPTNGHDVIRWSLQHAVRTGTDYDWADPQSMRVEIGAPQRDGNNNIVPASGVNDAVDAKIIASTKATYDASGYSGYNGYAGDYSGLSLSKSNNNTQWYTVTGVYSIPQGQDVTRFAFTATSTYNAGGGNLLDNITFSTVFGNLSAHQVEGNAVELKGYWGESDANKKMEVVIGSTTHTVDMSSVRGHSFTITIPAATIGSENALTVYHQDYYDARLTIYIAPTYSVELASGTASASDWSFSPASAKSGLTVAINNNGIRNVENVTVSRNITSTVEFNSSNASTAISNFNNTPRSKLLFTSDYAYDLTITRAEGEIDLNEHTTTQAFFTQNNQYGYSLTIKNGALKGIDGTVGWDDWYSGTLIFDNVTMTESLWTDGHDVIIKSGTYSAVQNYKKGDTPGTVTIYDGRFTVFNDAQADANDHGASNGTYTLYGGKYAFDPRNISAYTVIIPTGYAVQDNTDSDAGTYPWKVVNTNPSYAVEFENFHLTEVTHDHQWTFTMPPYDVVVEIEYSPVASVTTSTNITTNYIEFADAVSAWVNNSTLTLLANVETSSTIPVDDTCTLDLNGYGIKRTGSGAVIAINLGGNLTLNDSDPTTEHHFDVNANNVASLNEASGALTIYGGYITGGTNDYGGAIDVANSGENYKNGPSLTMNAGTLIGNSGAVGGVCVSRNGSDYYNTFTMNGGAICYNDNKGVGVFPQGTFHMNGGVVHHNNGNGIDMWHSKLLTLNNAVITDNNGFGIAVDTRRAAIEVQGRTIVSGNNTCDIFYSRTGDGSRALSIVGALHSEARIGIGDINSVTPSVTPNPFTSGLDGRGNASNFFSNNASYIVGLNTSGEAYLHLPYTVTYNGNGNDGGTVPTDAATYAGGVAVTIPSNVPTKTDYTFTGWLNSVDNHTYAAGDNFTITANTTLTAQWAINNYTITTNAVPSTGGTMDGAGNYDYGTEVTLTATPATDYHFVSWTKEGETEPVSTAATYIFTVTDDATYTATFALDEYRLDSIRTTWQVKIGNASPIDPTPYVTENPTPADTMGYVMIPVGAEFFIIPSDEKKPLIKNLELIEPILYLSTVTTDTIVPNGWTVTGTLGENHKISIADGATVTLDNVVIQPIGYLEYEQRWAGITCLGDATVVLNDGTTNTIKYFGDNCPGIFVPANKTLTIGGNTGSLTVMGEFGAAIGSGNNYSGTYASCGNIVINGGSINVQSEYGAGIGSGDDGSCGNIDINGGTIITSNHMGAGIGCGAGGSCGNINITGGTITTGSSESGAGIGSCGSGSCGDITISGGTVNSHSMYGAGIGCSDNSSGSCGTITISGGNVNAQSMEGAGIGGGASGSCGNIVINGGTVNARSEHGAGIGGGSSSACGDITITSGVTQITATTSSMEGYHSIGKGNSSKACGTVTIGGTVYYDGSSYQNGGETYLATKPIVYSEHYFSVSSTKQVIFALGNLQATYHIYSSNFTSWSWALATHQWDYIGNAAGNTSINGNGTASTNNVTVDLFGWVGQSSSWNSGAARYGISNSTTASNYGTGASEALKYNWGNTIGTGWRTLTSDEWVYLLNTRSTTSGVRYAKATVNSVNGVILLPDNWNTSYYSLSSTNTPNAEFTNNSVTLSDWTTILEAHGAIFLPTAGYRDGSTVNGSGTGGGYWSSTSSSSEESYGVFFYSTSLSHAGTSLRYYGRSVRLVRDTQ